MKYSILIFAILGLALAEVRPLLNFLRFVSLDTGSVVVRILSFLSLPNFFFFQRKHSTKHHVENNIHTLKHISYSQTHSLHSKRAPFVLADARILVETAVTVMTAIPSVSGSVTNPFVIRYVSPCASLPSAPPDVRNSDAPSVRLSATSPSVRFDARSSIVK